MNVFQLEFVYHGVELYSWLPKGFPIPLQNLTIAALLLAYYSLQPHKVWSIHLYFETTSLKKVLVKSRNTIIPLQ